MVDLSLSIIHNDTIKSLISKSTILICEYMINYNYFNTSPAMKLNIYKIHNSFEHQILLPNYSRLIYVKDIIMHGSKDTVDLFKSYVSGLVSFDDFSENIYSIHIRELNKYYDIIKKTSVPELERVIRNIIYKNVLVIQ